MATSRGGKASNCTNRASKARTAKRRSCCLASDLAKRTCTPRFKDHGKHLRHHLRLQPLSDQTTSTHLLAYLLALKSLLTTNSSTRHHRIMSCSQNYVCHIYDHTDLINQLDFIQLVMGLTSKKINVLIRLTSLIYYGAKPTVSFQPTDLEKVTQSAYQLIHSISSVPHFC
ncbi:hypothetical protein Cgig2_021484 [Carnegiea gigantea]|uniref:Uncharacterized protein n=1 Tax=Carnegiea gigantea TaxID=171969 RepID=A0A9Q1QHA8_9CARY|nr:hypothetical protein Cgig2_021484 [Carnegiea gigantea]